MKHRRHRHQKGSVHFDPRTQTYSFRYYNAEGYRQAERIGTKKEYPTKSEVEDAALVIRDRIFGVKQAEAESITLDRVANRYVAERMPVRHTTSRGYKGKLKIVRTKWGKSVLPLSPSAVELWLKVVKKANGELYSKKSRENLKSILLILHEAAMFFEMIPITANPMALVKVPIVKAAPKPKPRIVLSKDEFRLLLARFTGMYRVMVLLAGCVGLRCSEIFGLKRVRLQLAEK